MGDFKNMKLGDFIDLLVNFQNSQDKKEQEKIILSKEEVLQQYPIFTENTLRKAVKYQGLEYIKSGRNRYYDKESVENWIDKQKKKEIYNRFEEITF